MKKDYQKPVAEIHMLCEEECVMLSMTGYGVVDIKAGWF